MIDINNGQHDECAAKAQKDRPFDSKSELKVKQDAYEAVECFDYWIP
jgi:hypothetical protein